MPTNRTLIKRPLKKSIITPEAVAIFRELIRLEAACSCPPYEYETYQEKCPACSAWCEYMKLHTALAMPSWEWPCIERPDRHWHPKRTPPWMLAEVWVPDPDRLARYRALEAAARST